MLEDELDKIHDFQKAKVDPPQFFVLVYFALPNQVLHNYEVMLAEIILIWEHFFSEPRLLLQSKLHFSCFFCGR